MKVPAKQNSFFPLLQRAFHVACLAIFVFCALPSTAFAACASPTGTAGQIIYNADHAMPQYCDGTNWIGFGGTSGGAGPVAHWKLDESSGTTAYDSIGSDNGILTNTTWSWQPSGGKIDGALHLSDGDDPHVSYASRDFGNQFTITLWINPRSDTGANLLANKISWDTNNGFRLFLWDSTKAIFFETGDPTDSLTDNASSVDNVYSFDQWRHVAVTVDRTAGTARIYVDGVDRTSDSTIRTDFKTSDTWTLGTSTNVSSSFRGYMDDVRIYNRVLSAAEILTLYNAAVAAGGGATPPIAQWKLDETSGTTAEDSIGSNDGTLTGNGLTWQSSGGRVDGALQFGGTYDYIANTGATGLPALRSNMTISAWYYLTTTPVNLGYVASLVNQGANAVTRLGIDSTGAVAIGKYGASSGIINTAVTPSLNAWHLFTYTFDGTTNRLYIDGAQVGSSTNLPDNATPDEVYIGYDGYQSDATQFTGKIDDVRIYDRTLTSAEVAALYSVTACHAPAGDAGTIIFNADRSVLQYCNGSEWIAVDAGPSTTASYNTTGLVAHWKLDEGSGTTTADSSGNGNTGTLTNGPTWTTGKLAGAVSFDGTNDYIGVPSSSSLNNLSALTVTAWIRPNDVDSPKRIVTKSTECCMSQSSGGWRFIVSDNASALDKGLDFNVDYSGTNLDLNKNNLLTTGTWQHVAVTWDGTSSASGAHIYVNGQVVSSYDGSDDPTGSRVDDSGTALGIGGRSSGLNPGDWFDGNIDDVRVYNRVLSAAEIAALYSNTSPPVGMWLLDDGSGTTATDSAGSNNGTLTNGPVWQPSGGHDGGGAVQFDGTNDYINVPYYVTGGQSMTASFWMKPTGIYDYQYPLSSNTDAGNKLWNIYTHADGTISLDYIDAPGTYYTLSSTTTPITTANTWYHVVAVFDVTDTVGGNGTAHVYVNGWEIPLDSNAFSDWFGVGSPPLTIGKDRDGQFDGLIDDVRVWDRALSTNEVADLYNASAPAMPTPIAEWKMDEGSGTTAADSIGSNDGTLLGGPVWQPSGGKIGGALSFDGVDDEVDTGTIPGLVADPGNAFTFAFWYKAAPGANDDLFGWSAYRYCRTNFNNEHMSCTVASDANAVLSTTNVNDNNWHHIVYTYTNAIQYLYVDGNAEDSSSETITTTNPTAGIVIGAREFGGHIQAQFDDVRIYDTALTAAQIRSLYRAAACSGPTGAAGTMLYNTTQSKLQYCNGTNWVGVGK